jgi:hypothetical protein
MYNLLTGRSSSNLPIPLLVDSSGRPIVTKNHVDNVEEVELLASTTKNASWTLDTFYNTKYIGGLILIDVTAITGAQTVTFRMKISHSNLAVAPLLISGAAIGAIGTEIWLVYPGANETDASFDKVAGCLLPSKYLFQVIHSGAGNFTYSIQAFFIKAP